MGAGGPRRPRARARKPSAASRAPARTLSATLERLGIADVDLSPGPELVEALVAVRAGRRGRRPRRPPTASAQPPRGSRGRSPDRPARRRDRRRRQRVPAWFQEALRWHDGDAATRSSERAASWPTASACDAMRRRTRRVRICAPRSRRFHQLGRRALGGARSARARGRPAGDDAQARSEHARPAHAARAADRARPRPGMTTREAAAKLYLSPKTVEYHLRSVYRKLGVGSRSELAAVFARSPRLRARLSRGGA